MEKSACTIVLSELYCATSYAERLLFTIEKLITPANKYEAREILRDFNQQAQTLVARLLIPGAKSDHKALPFHRPLEDAFECASQLRLTLCKAQQLIEAQSAFEVDLPDYCERAVEFINMLYEHAHMMHEFCVFEANVDIPYPRLNLLEILAEDDLPFDGEDSFWSHSDLSDGPHDLTILTGAEGAVEHLHRMAEVPNEWEESEPAVEVARFYLPLESVMEHTQHHPNLVRSLEVRRDRKYQEMLGKGHEAMVQKKVSEGLQFFEQAMRVRENAEILTLVAWAYSLLEKNEKAKSLCLRAIQKDPDYGPPYNDLGAILLKEGKLDECLKWFELAKRSLNYQNREYPYINAGRAYLCQKKYTLAMEEFTSALGLAPHHEELKQTIDKLKQTLEKGLQSKLSKDSPFKARGTDAHPS